MIRPEDVIEDASAQDRAYAFVHESVSSAEIIHVLGPVDLANASELEGAIRDSTRAGRPVVLDLSDCDYIGAAGFSALLRSQRGLGRRLSIALGSTGIPALLFSMFADHGAFHTAPSIEQAILAVAPRRSPLASRGV